jgi:hypothetical protein
MELIFLDIHVTLPERFNHKKWTMSGLVEKVMSVVPVLMLANKKRSRPQPKISTSPSNMGFF